MTKEQADKLWLLEIGECEYSYDFAGRKIKRTDFNLKNEVGWIVGFIKPLELGGTSYEGNTFILNHRTNDEKGLNFPVFSIDHDNYEVKYDEKYDFFFIEKVLNDED